MDVNGIVTVSHFCWSGELTVWLKSIFQLDGPKGPCNPCDLVFQVSSREVFQKHPQNPKAPKLVI